MSRIATLLGKDVKSSSWTCLGIADGGDGVTELVDKYKLLRTSGGVIKTGKTELKFSDIRLLANNTGGGELKARLRFR